MFCCERPLLKELFSEGNPDNQQRKRPPTAGSQLKSSVAGLISNMMSKNPNYIRCIKVQLPHSNDNAVISDFVRTLLRLHLCPTFLHPAPPSSTLPRLAQPLPCLPPPLPSQMNPKSRPTSAMPWSIIKSVTLGKTDCVWCGIRP